MRVEASFFRVWVQEFPTGSCAGGSGTTTRGVRGARAPLSHLAHPPLPRNLRPCPPLLWVSAARGGDGGGYGVQAGRRGIGNSDHCTSQDVPDCSGSVSTRLQHVVVSLCLERLTALCGRWWGGGRAWKGPMAEEAPRRTKTWSLRSSHPGFFTTSWEGKVMLHGSSSLATYGVTSGPQ